jgi:hypothetical protein
MPRRWPSTDSRGLYSGGEGGLAMGPGSVANGENGHRGGLATGAGSDANGLAVWH